MAFDPEKFRKHLEESGLFSKDEIDSEMLSAQKDAKAEERRTILNTQKVETAPVAESSPAIAAAAPAAASPAPASAAVSVPTAPAGTSTADLFTGKTVPSGMGLPPEERVGKVGQNVAAAGGNFVQDSLDYARNAVANNPELTGALAAIPLTYGANKLGLFDNLGSKMSSSAAQPQPFVGGSGPRNTPSAPTPAPTPAVTPIQDWDIHNEPAWSAAAPAATTETPPAKPSQNLNLTEATDRMKNVVPAAEKSTTFAESAVPETMPAKTPWAPPAAEVINKPSMLSSGTTIGTVPAGPAATSTEEITTTPKKRGPAPAVPAGNYPNKTTFKTAADIPEGFVFRPDVGNLDRSMYNILGPEHRQQAKEFLTGGQMFGHSTDVNADVSKLTNQYFQRLQSEVPETILGRDARKLQNVPSDFGVYGGKGGFGKAAKVAGIAGTLFAAADLTNAATNAAQGKYGEAAGQALDVASGFIPPVAQFLTHIGNAGESPEEQARFERQRNYALKAGRGVAQGYDPRRLIGVAPPTR